jgi:hypothetical protein
VDSGEAVVALSTDPAELFGDSVEFALVFWKLNPKFWVV